VKIDEGQQKIKIVRTNRQSNLLASCQSIFSLSRHHPTKIMPKFQKKRFKKMSKFKHEHIVISDNEQEFKIINVEAPLNRWDLAPPFACVVLLLVGVQESLLYLRVACLLLFVGRILWRLLWAWRFVQEGTLDFRSWCPSMSSFQPLLTDYSKSVQNRCC